MCRIALIVIPVIRARVRSYTSSASASASASPLHSPLSPFHSSPLPSRSLFHGALLSFDSSSQPSSSSTLLLLSDRESQFQSLLSQRYALPLSSTLLLQCLTDPSYWRSKTPNNERLSFLGKFVYQHYCLEQKLKATDGLESFLKVNREPTNVEDRVLRSLQELGFHKLVKLDWKTFQMSKEQPSSEPSTETDVTAAQQLIQARHMNAYYALFAGIYLTFGRPALHAFLSAQNL